MLPDGGPSKSGWLSDGWAFRGVSGRSSKVADETPVRIWLAARAKFWASAIRAAEKWASSRVSAPCPVVKLPLPT